MTVTMTATSHADRPRSIMTINVIQPVKLTAQSAARMVRTLAARLSRRRTVHALRQLDDHLLADIGLVRDEIAWAVRQHRSAHGARRRKATPEWE
jgi:uncharacterized protein YjiS (DUF1127 family)